LTVLHSYAPIQLKTNHNPDVLNEFSSTKLDPPSAPTPSGPGRPAATTIDAAAAVPPTDPFGLGAGDLGDDDFAHQLQSGMADLLGELESSPEMQRQFEDMLRDLGAAAARPPASTAAAAAAAEPAATRDIPAVGAAAGTATGADQANASFAETIRRTMERMHESGEAAGAAAANASSNDADFMAALLREMESGGEGSDEDFSKMLLGMMEQLTNKEILYEPMKELHDKFPAWMETNKGKVPEADMKRYETQQKLVGEIVGKFEEEGYTDENVDSRKYIVDRMQQVCLNYLSALTRTN